MGGGRGGGTGTGSPVWFKCWRERSTLRNDSMEHNVSLTGRTRPYRTKPGSVWGSRASDTVREYECSCGHVGWSNHVDLQRLEQANGE